MMASVTVFTLVLSALTVPVLTGRALVASITSETVRQSWCLCQYRLRAVYSASVVCRVVEKSFINASIPPSPFLLLSPLPLLSLSLSLLLIHYPPPLFFFSLPRSLGLLPSIFSVPLPSFSLTLTLAL